MESQDVPMQLEDNSSGSGKAVAYTLCGVGLTALTGLGVTLLVRNNKKDDEKETEEPKKSASASANTDVPTPPEEDAEVEEIVPDSKELANFLKSVKSAITKGQNAAQTATDQKFEALSETIEELRTDLMGKK